MLVYSEVENRIAAFRKMLYEKLMVMPSSPDEQKKLIRSVCLVIFLVKTFSFEWSLERLLRIQ